MELSERIDNVLKGVNAFTAIEVLGLALLKRCRKIDKDEADLKEWMGTRWSDVERQEETGKTIHIHQFEEQAGLAISYETHDEDFTDSASCIQLGGDPE